MVSAVNYPSPVTVNGFSCRNCTEVDEAKKHIDPAKPDAGPFGINDKSKARTPDAGHPDRKAVLARERQTSSSYGATAAMTGSNAIGTIVDRTG